MRCPSALLTWSIWIPSCHVMANRWSMSRRWSSVCYSADKSQADGWRIASRGTYGVTSEPDRSWVLEKVTPQPLKTLEQPLHLKNPAIVSTKPRTYIECIGGGLLLTHATSIGPHIGAESTSSNGSGVASATVANGP